MQALTTDDHGGPVRFAMQFGRASAAERVRLDAQAAADRERYHDNAMMHWWRRMAGYIDADRQRREKHAARVIAAANERVADIIAAPRARKAGAK
jgi:hypothetical protein